MGCAHPAAVDLDPPSDRSSLYVQGVPFYPQTEYQCGPASLASVLNYWGRSLTPDEISRAIYLPRQKGTLSLDLWRYAKEQDFEARVLKGSLEKLKAHLARSQPVIAFLNLGYSFLPIGHFVVVVGLDEDRQAVIAYSGTKKDKKIPIREFLNHWQKTQYWSLVITPKRKGNG